MNAAVDFSILDAQLQQQLIESYRDMMKDAVDTFVDALAEDILSEKKMPLMDITQAISKAQPALLKAAMEGLIQAKHGDVLSQQQAECPCCQKKVNRSAQAPRTIETLLGASTIARGVDHCSPLFLLCSLQARFFSS
jgi:hypothetical protein